MSRFYDGLKRLHEEDVADPAGEAFRAKHELLEKSIPPLLLLLEALDDADKRRSIPNELSDAYAALDEEIG